MAAVDLTAVANVKAYLGVMQAWAQSTAYSVRDQARSPGGLYECITAGISSGTGTGPSGTTSDITDGTAHWKWLQAPGPTPTGAPDATLARLITSCSTLFESISDRSFHSGAHTYMRNGHGGTSLPLPETPVTAVSTLTIDGYSIAARPAVGGMGYVLVDDVLMLDGGYRFNKGIANVSVTYTAGYATIPSDLEQACVETVASWYRRSTRVDENSKSIQGEVVSFSTAEIPKPARLILDLYSRPWPR